MITPGVRCLLDLEKDLRVRKGNNSTRGCWLCCGSCSTSPHPPSQPGAWLPEEEGQPVRGRWGSLLSLLPTLKALDYWHARPTEDVQPRLQVDLSQKNTTTLQSIHRLQTDTESFQSLKQSIKPALVVYRFVITAKKVEAEGFQVQGQLGQFCETLTQNSK